MYWSFKKLSRVFKRSLDIKFIYSTPYEQHEFRNRLCQFLDSNKYNREYDREHNLPIIGLNGGVLTYLTECIIPEKQNSRLPLLLLFGNPASHSIYSKMFFSYEGKISPEGEGRDHRFWNALKEAGILRFREKSSYIENVTERSKSRKRELYDLSYESDFRIGLVAFYSMPSAARGSKWAGVEGLRKLFGTKALAKIADDEKKRVEQVIGKFLNPKGVIIVFQKDAYSEIKSPQSPSYNLSQAIVGDLHSFYLKDDSNIRLFCVPPTRRMRGKKKIDLLRKFKECILIQS
jgi:hypothetical protein